MSHIRRARVADLGDWLTRNPYVLPCLILIVGGFFRFFNSNWDNGHQLHPDERWIYEVVSGANNNPPLSWPHSLQSFLTVRDPTGGSPLNPHFFAYGSLPFYLLSLIAGGASLLGQHVPGFADWAQANSYTELPFWGRGLSAALDLLSVFLVFLLSRLIFGYWTGVIAMALSAFTVLDIQLSHFYAVDTALLPLTLLTLLAATVIATEDSRAPYVWGGLAFGAALATKTTALLLVLPLGTAAVLAAWSLASWPRAGPLRTRLWHHYRTVAVPLNRNLQWMLGTFLIAAVSFVVLEPYAVLDRTQLLSDLAQQTSIIVTNNPPFGVPYTIQYAHTIPYLYQLKNLLFWSLGIPLGLAAFAGTVSLAATAARPLIGGPLRESRGLRNGRLLLLCWVIPYFLFVGSFFAKFNRYMLPIVPVLTIAAAAFLIQLIRVLTNRRRLLAIGALTAVVGGSFLYSVAYMNVYTHLNTRIAASRWIFSHAPAGSTVAVEGPWDDPLPMDEQGHVAGALYHFVNIDLYAGEDTPGDERHKIANLTRVLTRANYIVMSSQRMVGSIPKLPYRYPIAIRYYHLLFGNRLNFRLDRQFQEHPQLGPIVVHDYSADESFHVYDHPNVRVFRRVGGITSAEVKHLLTTGLPRPDPSVDPATLPVILRPKTPLPDSRLMLTASQWHADQRGPTFNQLFPPHGFGMRHPITVWLFLLEILGLIAFPFTFGVFGNLLDRGFVIAKTMGLLLVGYLVWISVSARITVYERPLIVSAMIGLAVVSGTVAYRRRTEISVFARERWRYLLGAEAVFLAGFALFVLLRMWYPDLGHQFSPVATGNLGSGRMGEKQMELAFLNAIVRSRVFPPYDPFFAHGYINYYYYGFFLVGTLCKLAGIAPATGFNLAIATFFALLVGAIYSAALSLTRRVDAAVVAVIFVGLIGNLNGAWQIIQGLMSVAALHSSFPLTGGIVNVLSGLQQVVFAGKTLSAFDFWGPTRIMPGGAITEFPYFTYLFADLHPHLMAYPMVAAAVALAVNFALGARRMSDPAGTAILGALLLGAIAATNPWDYPTYLVVVALGALVGTFAVRRRLSPGALAPAVAWTGGFGAGSFLLYLPFKQSYHTVFATGLGLVRNVPVQSLQGACPPGHASECAGIVHDILVTPLRLYLEHFGLFLFIALSFLAMLISGPEGFYLTRWSNRVRFAYYYRDRPRRLWRTSRVARGILRRSPGDLSLFWGLLVILGGLVILQYYLLAFLVAVLGLIALAAAMFATRLLPAHLFVLALLGLGIAISVLTQIFYVKDFLAGGPAFRMNTIFKFYDQVWIMLALAAACMLSYVASRAAASTPHSVRPSRGTRSWFPFRPPSQAYVQPTAAFSSLAAGTHLAMIGTRSENNVAVGSDSATADRLEAERRSSSGLRAGIVAAVGRHGLWSACLALLLAASLVYTYAGTVGRETYRSSWLSESSVPFTLDGMAFMKVAYPGDYDAINWLNANVHGAPVIAEAGGTYYDWRSRVSMFTGLPSIINGIHEPEQRYGDEIDPTSLCAGARDPNACLGTTHSRPDDLAALYDSSNIVRKWQVIHRYGVRFIYLGWIERQCVPAAQFCYSKAGLRTFNTMVGHGLRVAYRHDGVTIYRVTS